jgi:four helix bundle protein
MKNGNILREKSYSFALRIIKLNQFLTGKNEYILGQQTLKSGTSIGANIEEAIQGESRADFTHKLSIALKEANETRYWLRLLKDSGIIADDRNTESLINDCIELIKLLTTIIKTTKKNSCLTELSP